MGSISVPEECTVLVIGGGPGGSYAASVLAREGIDVVVLEADLFPRYHVGESMLASMRNFLRFIDLDAEFNNHGFQKKRGAFFKLNEKREGYTDFTAEFGPDNYSWNVVRSEADDLMFRYAGKCGAKIFDGVKANAVEFSPSKQQNGARSDAPNSKAEEIGIPVSATWSSKNGTSGVINFQYLVDASGRAGLISTKYMKNRTFNKGLKNIASWGYWKGAGKSAIGTNGEGQPYFEYLKDQSGWSWYIPLHNGTTSIGVVQNQEMATAKKQAMGSPSSTEFYHASLGLTQNISGFLSTAELTSDLKHASDWSYKASSYASTNIRIVGDAGCFIDPFFSSGVHLAMTSALSAALTICAVLRGDCDESTAKTWHTSKVAVGYTRFLLVVTTALKQIKKGTKPILSDWDEDNFDKAFSLFRPVIQGTADVSNKLSQEEISRTVDFCFKAYDATPAEQNTVKKKLEGFADNASGEMDPEACLTEDDRRILNSIRAKEMLRKSGYNTIESWATDCIDGFRPNMKVGSLGLVGLGTNRFVETPRA